MSNVGSGTALYEPSMTPDVSATVSAVKTEVPCSPRVRIQACVVTQCIMLREVAGISCRGPKNQICLSDLQLHFSVCGLTSNPAVWLCSWNAFWTVIWSEGRLMCSGFVMPSLKLPAAADLGVCLTFQICPLLNSQSHHFRNFPQIAPLQKSGLCQFRRRIVSAGQQVFTGRCIRATSFTALCTLFGVDSTLYACCMWANCSTSPPLSG